MRLVWVPRSQWGATPATETFVRNRITDPADRKTSLQVHHTGAVDAGDDTPNRWTYERAVLYMRRLEWVRPDLGPLPYNLNPALAEDGETVWVFEGRGVLQRGAHTSGHNVTGVGVGWLGNFDRATPPADLDTIVAALSAIGARLRRIEGLVNIGNQRNPHSWEVWGHRDTTNKACPGALLYPKLAGVRFVEDVPMPDNPYLNQAAPWARDAWAKAWDAGVLSVDSHPRDTVTIERLMVFLDRADVFDAGTAGA